MFTMNEKRGYATHVRVIGHATPLVRCDLVIEHKDIQYSGGSTGRGTSKAVSPGGLCREWHIGLNIQKFMGQCIFVTSVLKAGV